MPRRLTTLLASAALLTGALLAWALPAIAGTGHRSEVRAAATRTTRTLTSAQTGTAPRTGTTTRPTSTSSTGTSGTRSAPTGPAPTSWVGTWSRPFTVSGAVDSDLIPPVLAVSASGRFAVGSGITNEDAPNGARANIATATASNVISGHSRLAGAQQTLAAGYLQNRLVLLTGTSPAADACCSSASTLAVSGIGAGSSQELASGLQGAATGALVPVQGGLLAAVDNQSGITVARSGRTGNFGTGEQLAGSDPTPPLMAVSSLAGGGAVVVWTAPEAGAAQTVTGTSTAPGSSSTASGYDQPQNQLIDFATAGPTGLPGTAQLAVTVPKGREIDALTVAEHGTGATVAWTESWYVGYRYLSEVFWADLRPSARVSVLSGAATAAVGLSMAASPMGREVLTWQACDVSAGTCAADAVLRPHGDAWGPVQTLGAVDPTSFPVATQSSLGQSLVGWTSGGSVLAAAAKPGAVSFYAPVTVAKGTADSNLALTFGAGHTAAAVWVQGTVDQKLVGARFAP